MNHASGSATSGESSGHDRQYRQQLGAPGQGKQVAPRLLRLMDPAEQARLLIHQQEHGVVRADWFEAGRSDVGCHELPLHPILEGVCGLHVAGRVRMG